VALLRAHWPIVAVTALAAALRFATLDLQSYRYDEVSTVLVLEQPSFGDMLSRLPSAESNPPLYYVLAWIWSSPFGTGEVGLRSFSALLGTATVPVVYWAGVRLSSDHVGLIAAALVAVQPTLIWYSQDARNYALLVFLAALSLALLVEALKAPDWQWIGGWAAASSLALATHYFAGFLVAGEALLLLALCRIRARAVAAVGGVAAAAAALAPLALDQEAGGQNKWIGARDLDGRLEDAAEVAGAGLQHPAVAVIPIALLLCALALLALRTDRVERGTAAVLAALFAVAVAVPLGLSAVGVDYFLTRNVLAAMIPLALVLAIAFGARRAGAIGIAAATALCVYMLAGAATLNYLDSHRQRPDWRALAERIGTPKRSRMIVGTAFSWRPLHYYDHASPMVAAVGPTKVNEVVAIANDEARPFIGRALPPRFAPGPLEELGSLRFWTYRARQAAFVSPAALRGTEDEPHEVLRQDPRAKRPRPSPGG
jgi:mannosyltransferase